MKANFNMPTMVDLLEPTAVESPPKQQTFSFLQPPVGTDEIGWLLHYKVLRKLGEGGMGIVFAAEDTHLRRLVALKVMLPGIAQDGSARERFLREARVMAALTHDHVVTIYQVGSAPTSHGGEISFLAMQFLQGGTLEEVLLERGRLPVGEAARIGVEVAEGLAAAHARGMIHRDIKPANIFLEAPRGRVKILDFGLARAMNQTLKLSVSGQLIGTPYFMAPEQATGAALDARADLFSFGCVLYMALAGELPFEGENLMEVLTKLAVYDPPALATKFPEIPGELSDLVQLLLRKKPEERPESAEVVAALLAPYADLYGCTIANHASRSALVHRTRLKSETLSTALASTTTSITPSLPPGSNDVHDRRRFLIGAGITGAGGLGYLFYRSRRPTEPANPGVAPASGTPIVVGILHSRTGTLRSSSVPVLQMTQLALERLNEEGGLLGRPIKYITRNGASDERTYAREAERLIAQDKVDALFGCWSSASRKAVKKVVEDRDHLLLYPLQYEGMERSPNIIYIGATPNQQILPALDWCLERKPKGTFYHVGSDYIFPRSAGAIIRHRIEEKQAQIVGEEYVPLGGLDFKAICQKIAALRPDFILNTINGSSNEAFFTQLRAQGVTAGETPTVSFSVDEQVLREMPARIVAGDYAAWNYFESIESERNATFVKQYQNECGADNAVTDAMEAAYLSVRLWAQAVTQAQSSAPTAVRDAIHGQEVDAPEGDSVRIDPENGHTWKYFRLGQITLDGKFRIVQEHDSRTPPVPYLRYRTVEQWEQFQQDLYRQWGNRWSSETG